MRQENIQKKRQTSTNHRADIHRNRQKKYPSVLLLFAMLLLFVWSVPAFAAQTIPDSRQEARLVDDSGLLSTEEASTLQTKLDEISERQQCDVVIVTVDSLDGKTPQDYADDFYDYNGYGYGDDRDGVLFLVSMGERKWQISTCGYGITAFTDAGIEYIGEKCKDYLSDGEYMDAFCEFADLSDQFLTQAKSGEAYDVGHMPKEKLSPFWIVADFGIGFLIMLIIAAVKRSKLKSVRFQAAADEYVNTGSMTLTRNQDHLVNRVVTSRVIPKEDHSGGGGSSTHTSSSGSSHGGGGGSF